MPSVGAGWRFEILSLTADELYLRLATDVDAWYFRFVPKPEAEPEPEPSELEKLLTTSADGSQKVWVWDYARDGYFGEGDLSAVTNLVGSFRGRDEHLFNV